ncbi:MAG: hypothetical protein JWN27_1874 [Candidatus Eremiobacteraeota bacterium]|nr:hypothetical protein [Candidatus Eremiobacteraeota bacterium]
MRRLSIGALFAVAVLAACGGGGGGTSSAPGPLPLGPTPTATPTTASQSFSSSNGVAIPSAAPGAATVPVALSSDPTGASANAALPSAATVSADTTIAVTYTSVDPLVSPLSANRSVQGRTTRDETKSNSFAFLKLQFSADLSLPQAPGFTFTVPGTIPTQGVAYWLAFYDPLRAAAGWQKGFEGPATVTPATVNGKSVTQFVFASNNQPLSFVANQTYWFAVIAVVTTAASPTPVPSTVPTTTPPPSGRPAGVGASPKNVQFSAITDAPVAVTFSETGYTGTFELHGNCTGIVNTTGASPTWTITPVGQGRCVIVAIGDRGSSAVVHVGVVTPFETPHPNPSTSPSHSPEPSESPEPTHAPSTAPTTSPSHSPEPSHSPTASPSALPSGTPTSTSSPGVTPTPAPSTTPAV